LFISNHGNGSWNLFNTLHFISLSLRN
jgi:hypothetical protein